MATKKTIDAIKDSRKWRRTASRKLAAMSSEERVRYLNSSVSEKLEAFRASGKRSSLRKSKTSV